MVPTSLNKYMVICHITPFSAMKTTDRQTLTSGKQCIIKLMPLTMKFYIQAA